MIKKYFQKIRRDLFFLVARKKRFQPFFERMHKIALTGMSFGYINFHTGGEKEVIKYLALRNGKPDMPVVFDVGANVGEYALEILSAFNDNVALYCFEPSKKAFESLGANLNGKKSVKMYNIGLGEKKEIISLYADAPGSGTGSIFKRRKESVGGNQIFKEDIQIVRLDDVCQEQHINHIYFLKIDVEGNELNVLKGAQDLIDSSAIDFIQFEFNESSMNSKVYYRDFFDLLNKNYTIHRIVKDGFYPIRGYLLEYEIFTAINCLAISKKVLQQ